MCVKVQEEDVVLGGTRSGAGHEILESHRSRACIKAARADTVMCLYAPGTKGAVAYGGNMFAQKERLLRRTGAPLLGERTVRVV